MALGERWRKNRSAAGIRSFFPTKPLHWVGVLLSSAVVLGIGSIALILSGGLDLRASPPHFSGVGQLLHFTLNRSVASHGGDAPQPPAFVEDEALMQMAAGHYANACSNCHGAPGLGQNPVALSMRPEPPKLDEAGERYSGGELFYILQHGIAYSGMPAWSVLNRPEEVWAMVRFVEAIGDMSFDEYLALAYNREAVEAGEEVQDDTLADLPLIAFGADPAAFSVDEPAFDEDVERPYLPGDIQSAINIEGASDRPAIGFVPSGLAGDALQVCVQCHNERGEGRADGVIPNLNLQSEDYIYNALSSYAHGLRQSGIMWPVAAQLSEPQMREVARYIGSRDAVSSPGERTPSADLVPRGEEIAEDGIPLDDGDSVASVPGLPEGSGGDFDMQVYACRSCHGAQGASPDLFPALDGQHEGYIAMQLAAFAGGGRGANNSYDPAGVLSHANLSEEDMAAVSAYFAAQPPRSKDASDNDQASSE